MDLLDYTILHYKNLGQFYFLVHNNRKDNLPFNRR